MASKKELANRIAELTSRLAALELLVYEGRGYCKHCSRYALSRLTPENTLIWVHADDGERFCHDAPGGSAPVEARVEQARWAGKRQW